ncbi:MAG: DinB family protein [Planctomycetota bacterium]
MTAPWSQIILGELDDEVPPTRNMLAAIPDEHLSWQPHEKSWPLSHLAGHMANVLKWQVFVLQFPEFDLASAPPPDTESVGDSAATLAIFDDNVAALREALDAATDAQLEETWTLRHGENVLFSRARQAVIRSTGVRHLIHHRGQLSLYLRQLNVSVPSTYGPTADTPPPGHLRG